MANRVTPLTPIENLSGTISAQTYFDNNLGPAFTSLNDASLGYTNYTGTDNGAVNAPSITCPFGVPSTYNTGMFVAFPPAFTNTGAATLTVSPLAPVSIRRMDGTALSGGELIINQMAMMIFDGTFFRVLWYGAATGTVHLMTNSTVQPGHLLCNGAAVSRTTYAPLFAVCGTSYGSGDGSTTFNVPNFGGSRFPLHTTPGTTGGVAGNSVALGVSQLPVHNHVININDPTHQHTQVSKFTFTSVQSGSGATQIWNGTGTDVTQFAATGITASSNNAGSGSAFSIQNLWLGVSYQIKT